MDPILTATIVVLTIVVIVLAVALARRRVNSRGCVFKNGKDYCIYNGSFAGTDRFAIIKEGVNMLFNKVGSFVDDNTISVDGRTFTATETKIWKVTITKGPIKAVATVIPLADDKIWVYSPQRKPNMTMSNRYIRLSGPIVLQESKFSSDAIHISGNGAIFASFQKNGNKGIVVEDVDSYTNESTNKAPLVSEIPAYYTTGVVPWGARVYFKRIEGINLYAYRVRGNYYHVTLGGTSQIQTGNVLDSNWLELNNHSMEPTENLARESVTIDEPTTFLGGYGQGTYVKINNTIFSHPPGREDMMPITDNKKVAISAIVGNTYNPTYEGVMVDMSNIVIPKAFAEYDF